ncbi:MAG: bifunctional proline dehydrogenase/L-glutamate gamma-semialdehyde dehydrogenase PutA [Pseudomonadales bacterium]|nr:bifunctional proline dehydrogenase/L-glutamate gamma-semialdehyde dehydrogenase PutA [Pseudomonadales bacterium]
MTSPRVFDFLLSSSVSHDALRDAMNRACHADEEALVLQLLELARLGPEVSAKVSQRAAFLVSQVRARKSRQGVMEAFMQEYDLSSEEGVVSMCLAEALLRIPDADTAEKLIADKLGDADWESHIGNSASVLVNASTWGLMLTGRLVALSAGTSANLSAALGRLIKRSGEPMVRTAIRQAMRIMGHQYVMGRTIAEALERSHKKDHRAYRYSFDMLGEAALTSKDVDRYMEAYRAAIVGIGEHNQSTDIFAAPSISVKLSALHPRFEYAQKERVLREVSPRVLELARLAMARRMALTIDTEEADRLMLALDVFATVFQDPVLDGWNGFGLALQSYQKRAPLEIAWLAALARGVGRRIPVRLVKGAYWDSEIKRAQVEGYSTYPVFTRKANTDVSYIACARALLADRSAFFPQFATHNAHTVAVVSELAGDRLDFEFQRLHGMGADLYDVVMEAQDFHHACRVYAPVGSHEDLLPYLVRRLLENGSNRSFVNRIVDESLPVEDVAEDPVEKVANTRPVAHAHIPLPRDLYGASRTNSSGVNLANDLDVEALASRMQVFADQRWDVEPILAFKSVAAAGAAYDNRNPASLSDLIGKVRPASAGQVDQAIASARKYASQWEQVPPASRADMLEKAADLMEQRLPELMALCIREAGKTVADCLAEVREAVDFARYYALQVRERFAQVIVLPGPTGETNQLSLHGRGVFACISPWNFPLAIFTGQVTAALAAGNTVLAKPAEQTPATAALVTGILHEAGIPREALQLLPGDGTIVGARLSSDPRIDGVAFTGSIETARLINRSLAARDAPLASLIAETGGQNAMLVDSSALPEQVVKAVIASAFLSAGQRCSALRVLYLQADVAEHVLHLLEGAMQELQIGDPRKLSTDIGPVIDREALETLQAHVRKMQQQGRLVGRVPLPVGLKGHFFAPCAFEIDTIKQLECEVFGPILHVVRYRSRDIDKVIDDVNAADYGLTLGIHSRIDSTQKYIASRIRAGNCYINRSMTGAVVGVQPFGGERLSGTGPKAGGPHYMLRFATERTLSINTAAVGGNASLLALND